MVKPSQPRMPDIVLSTLNAKYAHCSLALRYLYANLGELRERAVIREFVGNERACDLAETILLDEPKILGLGVYIWNARESLELVRILKAVCPQLVIVLGGPEVSHELERQEIVGLADHVVVGEGDLAFGELAWQRLVKGKIPATKIVQGGAPLLADLASPYEFYSDEDIKNRSVYVEASRGCPFRCEFCLSSLDVAVRQFPLDAFLSDMKNLLDRGVRQFKFIDRTFNLSPRVSLAILEFFLEHIELGLFAHFEMVPDRFPLALRKAVARFPPGSLQFEIGIQTFDPATSKRISRQQDFDRLDDNMRFLRRETHVHVHADLIVGLPGEDEACFARGFDRLVELDPHEVQVGILKRLRGTPIIRHDADYAMVYAGDAPYEILQNSVLPFFDLARLKRFARCWDLIANRGNFEETKLLLWKDSTPFAGFMAFSEWLFAEIGQFTGVALDRMVRLLLRYLSECARLPMSQEAVAKVLARDYSRCRPRLPTFLAELSGESTRFQPVGGAKRVPKRQARHLAAERNKPA